LTTNNDITRSQNLYHKLESEIKFKDAPMLANDAFEICYNIIMGWNALKLIQHLRKITLWELFYIYLWEPSENLHLERRLITDMFLTEGWS